MLRLRLQLATCNLQLATWPAARHLTLPKARYLQQQQQRQITVTRNAQTRTRHLPCTQCDSQSKYCHSHCNCNTYTHRRSNIWMWDCSRAGTGAGRRGTHNSKPCHFAEHLAPLASLSFNSLPAPPTLALSIFPLALHCKLSHLHMDHKCQLLRCSFKPIWTLSFRLEDFSIVCVQWSMWFCCCGCPLLTTRSVSLRLCICVFVRADWLAGWLSG